MMDPHEGEDELILRAGGGDGEARERLLARHRERLRQMIALRLDRRLAARIDPSDVVQEAMADADRELAEYLSSRTMPFYAWLRRFAWDRLVEAHRRHVSAERRSVDREQAGSIPWADPSAVALANRSPVLPHRGSESVHARSPPIAGRSTRCSMTSA
jgi:RNA polymerase sigma-70 factor (ECF subfamily)